MQPSIEKLIKFIRLESERGFDNRAVVGGLEKILPVWESEARIDHLPEETIQQVRTVFINYSGKPDTRSENLQTLWESMAGIPNVSIGSFPTPRPRREESSQTPYANTGSPARQQYNAAGSTYSPANGVSHQLSLDAPLTVISGIGPKNAEKLETLGLSTLQDLLFYFPRRYDDYSQLRPISRIFYGETVTIIGAIHSVNTRPIRGGSSHIIEAVLTDGTGSMRLTWFNQIWLANQLKPGMQIVVSGKVEQYLGKLVMTSPEWEQLEQEQLHTNRIVPVYSLTASITSKLLRRIMFQTVSYWAPRVEDTVPESIRTKNNLIDLPSAIREIHFPADQASLEQARKRLAFDEIFMMQLGVMRQKQSWKSASAAVFPADDALFDKWISALPYPLTNAQKKVLDEIRSDLTTGQPMNRLLQGDVGSGKTVVAALGLSVVTSQNGQGAFMAPTSILAEQHYRTLTTLMSDSILGVLQPEQVALLIGDTSTSEKEQIRAGLANGDIKLVIGTHALIEDPIKFQNLEFVVVDEQHRFGVEQRAALRSKGTNPHLLVMTATPIPRSLALTLHGDLDLSIMDEFPAGRQEIDTQILFPREREIVYSRVRSQVENGRQVFIVYPLVQLEDENDEAKAAVDEHGRLQREVFPKLRLGLLHGRMKPAEKDQVMADFRDKKLDILVSTSVVEVGVDIPNATMMVIEGANRFGLAQLHQFRGRVGRGEYKSYCILIPETENETENERLKALVGTNDGFALAEIDLRQRGPGDFMGTRQAGFTDLRMASLTDIRLIETARESALEIFAMDPDLSSVENKALHKSVDRFWGINKGDIS